MKKALKPFTLLLLLTLIVIQFFRPARNIASPSAIKEDISNDYYVPKNVEQILQTSCYDCHSNNTNYPWYATIQPIAWWLNDHIIEGKKEINFSEFSSYRIGRKYRKFQEIINQVKEDEMPLSSYTIIHRKAILNKTQKLSLTNWALAIRDSIKLQYPEDSLKRPQQAIQKAK